jgi:hypothetical protein
MNKALRNNIEMLTFAVDKLQSKARLYTPKKTCNYVTYIDQVGWVNTYDPTATDDYCESCIKKVVSDLEENDTAERPDDFVRFESEIEETKEHEGFCPCKTCGEIITCTVIWKEELLQHWIDLSDEDFRQALTSNKNCYELSKICDILHGSFNEFPGQTVEIAKRVFNAK